MTLDFACTQPQCGQQDTRPRVVKDIRYLSFTLILPRVTLAALCAVSWLTEPPSEDVVRSGSMPDPPRPSASSGRKRTWMGLSEEGGLLRMLKSQGAVRDSLISGHGQTQPHPPLTPLLCSGSMQGQRLLGTSPLILIKHKKKQTFPAKSPIPTDGVSSRHALTCEPAWSPWPESGLSWAADRRAARFRRAGPGWGRPQREC